MAAKLHWDSLPYNSKTSVIKSSIRQQVELHCQKGSYILLDQSKAIEAYRRLVLRKNLALLMQDANA